MTRMCAAADCFRAVPEHRVMCAEHWRAVSPPLQKTLLLLIRDGRAPRAGFDEALENAVAQVGEKARLGLTREEEEFRGIW